MYILVKQLLGFDFGLARGRTLKFSGPLYDAGELAALTAFTSISCLSSLGRSEWFQYRDGFRMEKGGGVEDTEEGSSGALRPRRNLLYRGLAPLPL